MNTSSPNTTRRDFLRTAGLAVTASGLHVPGQALAQEAAPPQPLPDYQGPNVVIVRFGGGVRRRETIDAAHTYAPYLIKELAPQGTLFKKMEMAHIENITTSHGEGTLYILTGKYEKYKDIEGRPFSARFESQVPTLFEYLRGAYNIPEHQALIINGEDRTDEEFYNFSNHHLFGTNFRSTTLSLFRYKTWLMRQQLAAGKLPDQERRWMENELKKKEGHDPRIKATEPGAEIVDFWKTWREYYGDSGLVNPRGDSLLTELAIRAMKSLQPRLMMINYNDPDYVHWGNMSHYTRGITIIDQGLRQLVETANQQERYRGNTIFVIVPDCGRDTNPFSAVPCQHHFGSRSSHEIWCLISGPGVPQGQVVDTLTDQSSVAATVAHFMKFKAEFAEGPVLAAAIA